MRETTAASIQSLYIFYTTETLLILFVPCTFINKVTNNNVTDKYTKYIDGISTACLKFSCGCKLDIYIYIYTKPK